MGSEEGGRSKAFFVSNAGLIEAKIKRRIDYLKHNVKDTVDGLEYTLIYMEHCNKFHYLKKLIANPRGLKKENSMCPHFRFFVLIFLFILWACASIPKGEQESLDNCKILGCTEISICRDIFGQHPTGSAADLSMINKKPICSFGTYYDLESDTVIGDTNNVVGTLHQSFFINAKIEGTSLFTPLGAYYYWEGEWNKLPLLFRKTLYKKGKGNVNCVFHASIGNPGSISNPQLKLGGIWLGDKKKTVFDRYGEASEVRHFKDGVIGYVFVLDKEKRAYLAIEVFPHDEEFIWSVQISGEGRIPLKGLAGIEIGSTEQELLCFFGDPSKRQPLRDIPGEFLIYTGKNYSFELDEKGKVRSIKIIVPESFLTYITN